jgi:hypothetical protein
VENEPKITKTAQKTIAILCFLFLLLFMKYKPYEHFLYGDSFLKEIFILYSYVINTTLGWVHESGHGVCYLAHCPDFFTALNGTLFQLLFPFLPGCICKKRGDNFGFYIGLFFVGFSSQYTAWYIATAHEGLYVSASNSFLGVDGYHDFYTVLSAFGLVGYDWFVSMLVKIAGYALMFYATFKMVILAWIEERE